MSEALQGEGSYTYGCHKQDCIFCLLTGLKEAVSDEQYAKAIELVKEVKVDPETVKEYKHQLKKPVRIVNQVKTPKWFSVMRTDTN